MSFETCPQCGQPKRRLVACTHCGFARRPEPVVIKREQLTELQPYAPCPEHVSVEPCPQCGGEKKRFTACPHCGFTKSARPVLKLRKGDE